MVRRDDPEAWNDGVEVGQGLGGAQPLLRLVQAACAAVMHWLKDAGHMGCVVHCDDAVRPERQDCRVAAALVGEGVPCPK